MRCRHPSCTFECCFHFHFCSSSSALVAPNTCSLLFVGSSSRRQATGEPAWLTSAHGLRRPQAAGSIADVSKWTGLNGFECAVNSQQVLAFSFACIVVAIATLLILFLLWKDYKVCPLFVQLIVSFFLIFFQSSIFISFSENISCCCFLGFLSPIFSLILVVYL